MIDMVPGFGQRFPKLDDEDPYWRDELVIETCCTSLDEALAAEARGAGRIELCVNLPVGGLTPPHELITEVVSHLTIPVNVLIRKATRGALWFCSPKRLASLDPSQAELGPLPLTVPRVACFRGAEPPAPWPRVANADDFGFSAADFVYDEEDVRQMIADIEFCKAAGAAGVVVGALTPEGRIDEAATRHMVEAAAPMPVTYHRAFDVCTQDPFEALEAIISLGCARLLTSGRAPKAPQGCGLIAALVKAAADRIIVMPGSGVKPENLEHLAQVTRAGEFHGTSIP